MTILKADGFEINYDPSVWSIFKYDDDSIYRDNIQKLAGILDGKHHGTKACDLLALSREQQLWFIELKNFKTPSGIPGSRTTENKPRIQKELTLEVALKVRDTIAGLIGTLHQGRLREEYCKALVDLSRKPRVVLIYDLDYAHRNRRDKIAADALNKQLKAHLRWLGARCFVYHPEDVNLSGLTVKYSPSPRVN